MKEKDENTSPPAQSNETLRASQIHVRCSAKVKAQLVTKAGGAGRLSSFMLAAALNPNAQPKAEGQRLQMVSMLGQLGKIGSNLNQLAHGFNAGESPAGYAVELAAAEVLKLAAEIRATLRGSSWSNRPGGTPGQNTDAP